MYLEAILSRVDLATVNAHMPLFRTTKVAHEALHVRRSRRHIMCRCYNRGFVTHLLIAASVAVWRNSPG